MYIAIFVILFFLVVFLLSGKKGASNKGLFSQKHRAYSPLSLFTPAEKNFLRALDRAVGKRYRVFGKVRIADIMTPNKKLPKKAWYKYFWQISSKHIDFILVEKKTLEPILAIELNDKSHSKFTRQDRDIMVAKAFTSARIPILWVRATRQYDIEILEKKIDEKIREKIT